MITTYYFPEKIEQKEFILKFNERFDILDLRQKMNDWVSKPYSRYTGVENIANFIENLDDSFSDTYGDKDYLNIHSFILTEFKLFKPGADIKYIYIINPNVFIHCSVQDFSTLVFDIFQEVTAIYQIYINNSLSILILYS